MVDATSKIALLTNIKTFPTNDSYEQLVRVTTQSDHAAMLDYVYQAINSLRIWQAHLLIIMMEGQAGRTHPLQLRKSQIKVC